MTLALGVKDVELGEKFVKTLMPPARHKALYGGRGSAKTWSVATYLAVLAGKYKKRIVCARQFQNSIRDSSKETIEKRIGHLGIRGQFDVTDRTIIHKSTGSDFLFIGLERNIESIRSLEGADVVWVDEARTTKAKSLEVLLPTVRAPGSEFIWTWNPEDPDDPVDKYFRKGLPPQNSIVTFVDYTDNPYFYSTELPYEMETLKKGNFERYKHVWLGGYDLAYDSKIFPNVAIGVLDIPKFVPPRYGLDFGFGADPSFIVEIYIMPERRQVYISAEASGRVTMTELPALIKSILHDDSALIKADSSQPGTIEFLQSKGLNLHPARKGPGSVKSGINFLQGYQITINPSCEAMREEARLYSWMTDRLTGKVLSQPVDANNHGWDACRYAVEDVMIGETLSMDDADGGVLKLKLW